MDLYDALKKFKNITPSREYTDRSRRAILGTLPFRRTPFTFVQFLLNSVEVGSTIVFTGILILLIIGGFSNRLLTPTPLKSLDLESLKAEAHAIDIQIQLANLKYNPAGASALKEAASESTLPVAQIPVMSGLKTTGVAGTDQQPGSSGTNTVAPQPLTIDEALEKLSR